jgi:N4-(beta-N-acetylglucosaminyl)-L-asparaginase
LPASTSTNSIPAEQYVGYGGLPNADGAVQLDASCMHGPKKRAGGVAALEGVRTPSLVAKAVMELTDNHLLVGQGAQAFARNAGFTIEPDLNTEASRKAWLDWKRKTDSENFPDPKRRPPGNGGEAPADPFVYSTHMHGTIHCSGVNATGEICGVTSTSGRAFKIPGRVGDYPSSAPGLRRWRRRRSRFDRSRGGNPSALLHSSSWKRCARASIPGMRAWPRSSAFGPTRSAPGKENGDPNFNILFYILNVRGEYAGVAMYPRMKASVDGLGRPTPVREILREMRIPAHAQHRGAAPRHGPEVIAWLERVIRSGPSAGTSGAICVF